MASAAWATASHLLSSLCSNRNVRPHCSTRPTTQPQDGLSDDSDLMDDASDEDEEEEEEDDETEAVDAEQRGTSAAAAAAAAAGQQQAPWERFASLAWSKGREPDHTCYIQVRACAGGKGRQCWRPPHPWALHAATDRLTLCPRRRLAAHAMRRST